jgi:hypothetical protein
LKVRSPQTGSRRLILQLLTSSLELSNPLGSKLGSRRRLLYADLLDQQAQEQADVRYDADAFD